MNVMKFLILLPALLFLPACAVRAGGGQTLAAVDSGLITGSVGRAAPQIDPQCAADSHAVLAQFAALAALGGGKNSAAWENAAAGSSGVISAVSQAAGGGDGEICRSFRTTRASFDGIALYKGKACKYGASPWALSYLQEE